MIAKGVDPGDTKKAQKAACSEEIETFEVIAREWHTKFSPSWAASHSGKILRRLELYIFPWLGSRPIKSITAPELLSVLRRIEAKGILETVRRAQQNCGQVFRYAVATGRAERDPSNDLRGAIPPASGKTYGHYHRPERNCRTPACNRRLSWQYRYPMCTATGAIGLCETGGTPSC